MTTLSMSRTYKCRPSEIINLQEEYDAYCFDAACALFYQYLDDKKTPMFDEDRVANTTLKRLEAGLL